MHIFPNILIRSELFDKMPNLNTMKDVMICLWTSFQVSTPRGTSFHALSTQYHNVKGFYKLLNPKCINPK